ncbi:MAG TPA: hypothetical protein VFI42_08180 [Thermomicrobiaceae bacterium]|nr:hypothetical protein [Thermomicrobiaceae bacterium]
MSMEQLQGSAMMQHLMDALGQGKDIGHYGRLTVAMVGHLFLDKQELLKLLEQGTGASQEDLMALVQEVAARDYNPPTRQQILDWQRRQDFPICPHPEDPDACNVYEELKLPERIYDQIKEYRAEQFEQEEQAEQNG